MTRIKYLPCFYTESVECSIEDYVTGSLLKTLNYEPLQTNEKIENIASAFAQLINTLHDNKQLTLLDITRILSTYEDIDYAE
jgi:hypothetical protein